MPSCADHFCNTALAASALSALLDFEYPSFACEAETCSPFSPGIVSSKEQLAFLLINPLHVDGDKVLPGAFEQLGRNDLSTLRLAHSTRAEAQQVRAGLIALGANRIPVQERAIEEALLGSVAAIRAALHEGARTLGVFDTALEDNRGHASVMSDTLGFTDRMHRARARERIWSIFAPNRISFNDLLARLAANDPAAKT